MKVHGADYSQYSGEECLIFPSRIYLIALGGRMRLLRALSASGRRVFGAADDFIQSMDL